MQRNEELERINKTLLEKDKQQSASINPVNSNGPRKTVLMQDPSRQQENRDFCEDAANSNKPDVSLDLQPKNFDFRETQPKDNMPEKVSACCEQQNAKHFPLKEVQTQSLLTSHDEWMREMNAERIRQSPYQFLEEEVNLAWTKVKKRGNNKAGHIVMKEIEALEENQWRQANQGQDSILLEEDKTIDRFQSETLALNIFMAKRTELNQVTETWSPTPEEESLPIQCVDVPEMKLDIEGVTFRVIPDMGA
ncbi:MAG: hypothetical protein GY816_20740, partial [Cytophagales bacterium]|nr:hypothetical protein [Cytophagales bacterium]